MKLNIFFSILLLSSLSFSANFEGIESPDKTGKEFFNELKKGSKGIQKAMENMADQDSEAYKYARKLKNTESFQSQLSELMVEEKQGKVIEYKKTDEVVKLDGDLIKQEYTVKFQGGATRTIELIFIRPTVKGNMHLSEAKFLD